MTNSISTPQGYERNPNKTNHAVIAAVCLLMVINVLCFAVRAESFIPATHVILTPLLLYWTYDFAREGKPGMSGLCLLVSLITLSTIASLVMSK